MHSRQASGDGDREDTVVRLHGRLLHQLLPAPDSIWADEPTRIWRGLDSAVFGSRSVRTPFSKLVLAFSASMPLGRVICRTACPEGISMTSQLVPSGTSGGLVFVRSVRTPCST